MKSKTAQSNRTMKGVECSTCGGTQHNIPQANDEFKKVKSKDVFEQAPTKSKPTKSKPKKNTKVPKGSHRMPDGSIMKDKDMKSKRSSGY